MQGIMALIRRISRNQVKCNHIRNQKLFVNYILQFWKLHKILNIREKKDVPGSKNISRITDSERCDGLNI